MRVRTFPWLIFVAALIWAYRREQGRRRWRSFWDELNNERRGSGSPAWVDRA